MNVTAQPCIGNDMQAQRGNTGFAGTSYTLSDPINNLWFLDLMRPVELQYAQNGPIPGALTSPLLGCRPGQLGLAIQTNVSPVLQTITMQLDIATPNRFSAGQINSTLSDVSTCGNMTIVDGPTLVPNPVVPGFFPGATEVNRFIIQFEVGPTNLTQGEIVFSYTTTPQLNINGWRSNAQMRYCVGASCNPAQSQVSWDYVPGNRAPLAFGDGQASRTIIGPANITISQTQGISMMIDGDVEFNGQWGSQGPELVYLSPNSRLTFANQAATSVSVHNTEFIACAAQPFDAIAVGANTNLAITGGLSLIYGANTGLDVLPGGSVTTQNLRMDGVAQGVRSNDAVSVSMTAGLMGPNMGIGHSESLYDASGLEGTSGIDIFGANGALYAPSTNTNGVSINNVLINNFNTGIRARSSLNSTNPANLSVRNNTINGPNCFVGILNTRNTDGVLSVIDGSITSQRTGIQMSGNRSGIQNIRGTNITAVNKGIHAFSNRSSILSINSTTIGGTIEAGISIEERNSPVNAQVGTNTITMPPNANLFATGILLRGINTWRIGHSVQNNIIDIQADRGIGIYANSILRSIIGSNYIDLNGIDGATGIEMENTVSATSFCNTVTASNQRGGTIGLLGVNAQSDGLIDCNYFDHMGIGLLIDGVNTNSTYSRNGFVTDNVGLQVGRVYYSNPDSSLDPDAFVLIGGDQIDQSNVWNSSNASDALYRADPVLRHINRFQVPTVSPYVPIGADPDWIESSTASVILPTCPSACYRLPLPPIKQPECPEIIAPSILDSIGPEKGLYYLENAREIARNGIFCPTGIPTCYLNLANIETNLNKFLASEELDDESSTAYRTYIADFDEANVSLDSSITFFRSLTRSAALTELEIYEELTTMQSELSESETCDYYTELYKTALNTVIQNVKNDSLTAQENSSIQAIANMCPSRYGAAVSIARSISPDLVARGVACNSTNESLDVEQLKLSIDDDKLLSYNLMSRGDELLFHQVQSGIITISAMAGGVIVTQDLNSAKSLVLPTGMTRGLYVITVTDKVTQTVISETFAIQ